MTDVTDAEGPAREDGPRAELPQALRDAAADVIIDAGLGGFSLREVARRAGVSHAAPGYHFGDARGLLTSLAVEGMQTLHREMADAAAAVEDPIERLTAIGVAYVRVGTTYPAHCEIVFREDMINPDQADYAEAGLCAFGVLVETIEAIAAAHNKALPVDDAARLCWSAMQGLIELYPKMSRMEQLHDPAPSASTPPPASTTEELVGRFTDLIVTGLLTAT